MTSDFASKGKINSKEQRNEKKNKEYKGKRLKRFVIPNPRGGTVLLGVAGILHCLIFGRKLKQYPYRDE